MVFDSCRRRHVGSPNDTAQCSNPFSSLPGHILMLSSTAESSPETVYLENTISAHMGGCQNYGPIFGPLNTRCRIILRTQTETTILTTTDILSSDPKRRLQAKGMFQCIDPISKHRPLIRNPYQPTTAP